MTGERRDNGQGGEDFLQQATALFGDSVDGLDGQTRSRLNRGRQQALAAAGRRRYTGWNAWLPAGAAATVAVFAVALWNGSGAPDLPAAPPLVADYEMLLEQDSLELLEDLEFYSWLEFDEEPGAGAEHVG